MEEAYELWVSEDLKDSLVSNGMFSDFTLAGRLLPWQSLALLASYCAGSWGEARRLAAAIVADARMAGTAATALAAHTEPRDLATAAPTPKVGSRE